MSEERRADYSVLESKLTDIKEDVGETRKDIRLLSDLVAKTLERISILELKQKSLAKSFWIILTPLISFLIAAVISKIFNII